MLSRQRKKPPYAFMLLMVFVLPLLISWGLYYFHDKFTFKTTNHGTLITPAIPLEDVSLNAHAVHVWKIVYAPKICVGDVYEKTTFSLHQLLLVLGENQKRVHLNLLLDKTCHPQDMHDFQHFSLSPQQLALLEQSLGSADIKDKIYLIDPIGNAFMYYPSDINPMLILKDVKKVLEVSQIG